MLGKKNIIVAMTTTNSEREAKRLAERMIEDGIAACVQIMPKIHSIYMWDGEVRDDIEYLLMIKTREGLARKVRRFIEDNHPYEVPEFIILPVIDALDEYVEWICDVTK